MKYIRYLSILLGLLAYTAPFIWANYRIEADIAAQKEAGHGGLCGLPAMGIMFGAYIISALLSLIGFCLAFIAFRKLPKPRPKNRIYEIRIITFPSVILAAYLLVLVGTELLRITPRWFYVPLYWL